jgi:tetratricopeptide (TPR) repeat protein
MNWCEEVSPEDYQRYWSLSPDDRQQMLQDEQISDALKALVLYQQGQQCLQENQPEQAIAHFEQASSFQPSAVEIWQSRGWALYEIGRYEESITSYDKRLEAEPDNSQLWYLRGLALRKLGRLEGAIANFDLALQIQPNFHEATHSKLFTLLQAGQIWMYLTDSQKTIGREKLLTDLRNLLDSFVRTKLPALVAIALAIFFGTRSRAAAWTVASLILLVVIVNDVMAESRR